MITPIVLPAVERASAGTNGHTGHRQSGEDPDATDAEDAYFSELIARLPSESELPEVIRDAGARPADSSERDDAWQPRLSLEEAVERLSPQIRETLEQRLGGQFREVRRYRPSRTRLAESAAPTRPAGTEEVELPDDESETAD